MLLGGCTKKQEIVNEEEYTLYTNVKYGDHKRNYVDICLPKDKTGTIGLIFMIHGGGWGAGDKECYTENLKSWCLDGYVTAALNYRYANGDEVTAEEILDDITASLQTIKDVALEYNLNVEKMLLYGGSAGVHLSLLYAYEKTEIAPIMPAAVVSLSGPTDLTDENFYLNGDEVTKMLSNISGMNMLKKTIAEASPFLKQVSPITYVNSLTVPTIICHGILDSIVPYSNAVLLDEKLTTFGVKHDFITFTNSNHGLESDPDCLTETDRLMHEYASLYL